MAADDKPDATVTPLKRTPTKRTKPAADKLPPPKERSEALKTTLARQPALRDAAKAAKAAVKALPKPAPRWVKGQEIDGWTVAWARPHHALVKRQNGDGKWEWKALMSDGKELAAKSGGDAQEQATAYEVAHGLRTARKKADDTSSTS